jgi:hypothetical protein
MAQVITIAGERLFALKAQNNEQLDIDTFIFANVPGQDPNATIDRNESVPPVGQQVHQQIVQQVGRINDNVVVYSTVLDSVTGPFDFNWVGLYSSANQTLIAVSHIPNVSKTITVPGTAGNTLNRNFGIEYSGIADLAGITVQPETWQLDFTARLSGMDELTRQLAADMNGKDWFIDDGFKVVPRTTANTFNVTAGAGYVSGLRVELKQDHILTLQSYPQFVYVDAWFDGDASSKWAPKTAFTVTNGEMDDYIDVNGKQHYVFKLASITAVDVVEDLRETEGVLDKIKNHESSEGNAHPAKAVTWKNKDVEHGLNDLDGFTLALLKKANIDAGDDIDTEEVSKRLFAMNKLFGREGKNGVFKANPSGFEHRAGTLRYLKKSTSEAKLITDLSKFMPAGHNIRNPAELPASLKAYFVSRSGSGADGISWATAFNSVAIALSQNDVDVVFVDGTDRLTITEWIGVYAGTRDISVISVGGRASMSPQRETSWSAGAEPNTYKSSSLGGTPVQVLDPEYIDDNGDRIPLISVTSEAEVSDKPGSWYRNGSTVVIRLFDDAIPDNNRAQVMRSSTNRFSGVDCKMYLFGFDFYSASAGAFSARLSTLNSVIAADNCGFYNCPDGDGYQIKDVGLAIAINCRATANSNDGFNYHSLNGLAPHIIEVDCAGMSNLESGTGNGSTCHEDVVCFRLGGTYYDNNGPGIADVDSSKSYNVACTSNYNKNDINSYGTQINGSAIGWFDGYSGFGNVTTDIGVKGGGTIHYRDSSPKPISVDGTGVVDEDFS